MLFEFDGFILSRKCLDNKTVFPACWVIILQIYCKLINNKRGFGYKPMKMEQINIIVWFMFILNFST